MCCISERQGDYMREHGEYVRGQDTYMNEQGEYMR